MNSKSLEKGSNISKTSEVRYTHNAFIGKNYPLFELVSCSCFTLGVPGLFETCDAFQKPGPRFR